MSLILEALRKSEAERRLGSAPGVLAPMPVLHASTPRSHAPLAIAGVLALAALLAFGWWWTHREQAAVAPSIAGHSARATSSAAANTSKRMDTPVNPQGSIDAPRASQSMPIITLPVTGAPRAIAPDSPARAEGIAPQASTATPNPATKPEAPTAPVIASVNAVTPLSASTAPAIQPAPEPALLPLSDLPADERGGLPVLKVSMHVYADDPAQRFMIINGQRVGEGAQIGDGIVIVHIRRDGAEIDMHGRRLLLPKP